MNETTNNLTIIATPNFDEMALSLQEMLATYDIHADVITNHFWNRNNREAAIAMYADLIRGRTCIVLSSGPGSAEMEQALHYTLGVVSGFGPDHLYLIMGYLNQSRGDKDELHEDGSQAGKQELGLSSFAIHMINAAAYFSLSKMIVLDPHALQTTLSGPRIGNVRRVTIARKLMMHAVEETLKKYPNREIVIHFPDKGSRERYYRSCFVKVRTDTLKTHGVTIHATWGDKTRIDSETVEFHGVFGETKYINEACMISFDDEGATFTTNLETYNEVASFNPFKFSCAVVHLVACGNAATKIANSPIDHIFATDSIPINHRPELLNLVRCGRISILSWLKPMARIIEVLHTRRRDIYEIVGYEDST
jgi:phosphoribosylpyrophosphate synthetase